jgi:hypothetical protein
MRESWALARRVERTLSRAGPARSAPVGPGCSESLLIISTCQSRATGSARRHGTMLLYLRSGRGPAGPPVPVPAEEPDLRSSGSGSAGAQRIGAVAVRRCKVTRPSESSIMPVEEAACQRHTRHCQPVRQ